MRLGLRGKHRTIERTIRAAIALTEKSEPITLTLRINDCVLETPERIHYTSRTRVLEYLKNYPPDYPVVLRRARGSRRTTVGALRAGW